MPMYVPRPIMISPSITMQSAANTMPVPSVTMQSAANIIPALTNVIPLPNIISTVNTFQPNPIPSMFANNIFSNVFTQIPMFNQKNNHMQPQKQQNHRCVFSHNLQEPLMQSSIINDNDTATHCRGLNLIKVEDYQRFPCITSQDRYFRYYDMLFQYH